jgi:hypothetical protein
MQNLCSTWEEFKEDELKICILEEGGGGETLHND